MSILENEFFSGSRWKPTQLFPSGPGLTCGTHQVRVYILERSGLPDANFRLVEAFTKFLFAAVDLSFKS